MNNTSAGTHDPEWMRTHTFTVEDVRRPGGRGLAFAAERFHGNTTGRKAQAEIYRLDRQAAQQQEGDS